ncbi:hypothetical protein Cgig2_017600 [Carnegiea gigantea]|uniref:Uncharacterized protein n=1 Tax=Carnegiea gigantea TaxID=171969 RepID=A0A9Q1QKI9_9CARY|nr:hypothetical protein Cgig2_017600 [Carnegiea gigantea]
MLQGCTCIVTSLSIDAATQVVCYDEQRLSLPPTCSLLGVVTIAAMIPRVIARSLAAAAAITIAVMIPFFGDLNALKGAFGFLPLDFAMRVVLFNFTFKPSEHSLKFWLYLTIPLPLSCVSLDLWLLLGKLFLMPKLIDCLLMFEFHIVIYHSVVRLRRLGILL